MWDFGGVTCPTLKTYFVALLLILLCWWLLLVLVRRTRASTILSLMTHLEASLTATLVTLATVVSAAVVAFWEVPSISALPVATR